MKKILLIDDDKGLIQFLAEELIEKGFEVIFLRDPGLAIDQLKFEEIHAIILDIMMPVPESWPLDLQRECNNGLETGIILFKIIRKEFPSIPIIFHSAKSTNNIKNDRFTYTIIKPEFFDVIGEKLNELISMSSE